MSGFDVAQTSRPESWLPLLRGVNAIVNWAGILQDIPGKSTEAVHQTAVKSLFAACERSNVQCIVHLSAINVERKASSFSEIKLAGDVYLVARDPDRVVPRPAVVVGHAADGAAHS
jgi:hypothetical protein